MIKLFRFIVVVGLLCVISSCDFFVRPIPMTIDKLNTSIIEIPIDTDRVRVGVAYNGAAGSCWVNIHVPEGSEVNEDSLDISFNVPNYSCGKVEKSILENVGHKIIRRRSEGYIDTLYRLEFSLYNSDPGLICNVPAQMYLKMSGVIVKDGKSLMNDTITVVDLPRGVSKSR